MVVVHTWASVKESKGYSHPEKFSIEIPPFKKGTLWQNIPPLENFRPILPPESEDSPPKIGQIFGFPPLERPTLWIPP